MSFYKVSALSVLAISLAACSSSGDKTDSQPTTTIPSATTGTTGSANTGSTTNTGNTGTTTPTTPAPTTPTTPVTQPTVLVPAPTAPTDKALEAANKAKTLSVPSINGDSILRPATFDGRTTPYTKDDKFVRSGADIASTNYSSGFSATDRSYLIIQGKGLDNYIIRGSERVYQQPYSIVFGNYYSQAEYSTTAIEHNKLLYQTCLTGKCSSANFTVDQIAGVPTETSDMPVLGKAVYGGEAYTGTSRGNLTYHVDFGSRKGYGTITGLGDIRGDINLKEASITSTNGGGTAKLGISNGLANLSGSDITGNYSLGFYGPKAAEVAGKVMLNEDVENRYSKNLSPIQAVSNSGLKTEIGFGGTRGAITK